MSKLFEQMVAAIVEDNPAKVKGLLAREPEVVVREVAKEERYHSTLMHWIYLGDTLLHVAAAGNRVEIAQLLLGAGAEVSSAENRRRSQPLHYACDGHFESPAWNPAKQVAMIRLLLKAGANIDAQDKNGGTPLHRAVRNRCAAAVKCLLKAGAEPTIRNKPGSTAFHLAVQNTGRVDRGPRRRTWRNVKSSRHF